MLSPKPGIEGLPPNIHGGINHDEMKRLGISAETVLDFSVSCNPFGPPPGIKEALSTANIECYPDSESSELKHLLAGKLGMSPENLIIGSGSTEIIRLVALAYFGTGDKILIPQPTYSEYEIACQLTNAKILKQQMSQEASFRLDIKQTMALIREQKPKGIFLCNPNNPTGNYLTRDEFRQILSTASDSLVILDEAYIAFTSNAWQSTDMIGSDNLVILRSMTKDYALAGLRLGYAVATSSIISVLKRLRPPWNVNAVAQKAGVFVLNTTGYLEQCSRKIREAKDFLIQELRKLGLSPLPSQTNFFLVEVENAAQFKQAMLGKGILVRDCTSFGLPHHIRLAPRTLPECQRLIAAIAESRTYSHAS